MAVISKTIFFFGGEEYTRRIKCDARGIFTCNLPPCAMERLGFDNISAKTLDELERNWANAKKSYEESGTNRRKVIIYKVQSTARVERGKFEDDNYQLIFEAGDVAFCSGTAIDLACGVYEETEVSLAGGKKRYTYKPVDSSISRGLRFKEIDRYRENSRHESLMEWTPHREQFFAEIGMALEALIVKLSQFMSEPLALEQKIDAGIKLLPSPRPQDAGGAA